MGICGMEVLSYHSLHGKGLDLLDGARGPLLEGHTVHLSTLSAFPLHNLSRAVVPVRFPGELTYSLVHVDGVLASNDLLDGGLRRLLSLGRHFLQFGKLVIRLIEDIALLLRVGGVLTAVGVWG